MLAPQEALQLRRLEPIAGHAIFWRLSSTTLSFAVDDRISIETVTARTLQIAAIIYFAAAN